MAATATSHPRRDDTFSSPLTSCSSSSTLPTTPRQDAAFAATAAMAPVLHTPRRGRRMAGIDMGWDSPPQAPLTMPRFEKSRRRTQADYDAQAAMLAHVTPRKRRAATPDGTAELGFPQTPTRRSTKPVRRSAAANGGLHHGTLLLDNDGYASAVLTSTPPSKGAQQQWQPSPADSSPACTQQEPLEQQQQQAPKYHHLELFTRPAERRRELIAVEVDGMGRVAVDREMAIKLGAVEEGSSSRAYDDRSTHSTTSSSRDAYDVSSHASSSTSAHTNLTTPSYSTGASSGAGSDPSPSFSLSSHFPASEDGSPVMKAKQLPRESTAKHGGAPVALPGLDPDVLARVHVFKNKLLGGGSSGTSSSTNKRHDAGACSLRAQFGKLTMQWPDLSTSGHWADAATGEDPQTRLEMVTNWLEGDADEDDDADEGGAASKARDELQDVALRRIERHPMVAKALRDREKKTLRSARSVPSLRQGAAAAVISTPPPKKQRGRKIKGARMAKVSGRKARGAAATMSTPPSSVGTYASLSSLGSGGSAGSIMRCCAAGPDVGGSVQCDDCSGWYHFHCAGIADEKELGDQWFCRPCQQGFSRDSYLSPASTVALPHAPSSVGSIATAFSSVHGSHGSLPAFPRTFATTHVGVGTPSRLRAQASEHVPVFAQADSPLRATTSRAGYGTLALAPSPLLDGADASDMRKHHPLGATARPRASRIGWHTTEPDSPLGRKSATFATFGTEPRSARYRTPSYGSNSTRHQMSNARSVDDHHRHDDPVTSSPSFAASASRVRRPSSRASRALRTPSPSPGRLHFGAVSTPSRHATQADRDSDDVFSTPSRHLPGNAWWGGKNQGGGGTTATTPTGLAAGQPFGLQTPSRSARRRESSAGWALGMSTPGSGRDRDLLFGGLVSTGGSDAYSTGGLPSLGWSAAGDGDGDEDFPRAHWPLSSPTTRALRSRKRSNLGGAISGLDSDVERDHNAGEHDHDGETTLSAARVRSTAARLVPVDADFTDFDTDAEPYTDGDLGPDMDPPTSDSPYPQTPGSLRTRGSRSGKKGGGMGMGLGKSPGSPTPSRGRSNALAPLLPGAAHTHAHCPVGKEKFGEPLAATSRAGNSTQDGAGWGGPHAEGAGSGAGAGGHAQGMEHVGLGLGLAMEDVLDFY